jgi:hypothetical protein
VKEIEVCPIPESVAEQMAAKNEGSRNWKMTLLESMTPFWFILCLKRVWDSEHRKPAMNPIAVAAPGL